MCVLDTLNAIPCHKHLHPSIYKLKSSAGTSEIWNLKSENSSEWLAKNSNQSVIIKITQPNLKWPPQKLIKPSPNIIVRVLEKSQFPSSFVIVFMYSGVLGWLLVVVLFAPIRGGSLGICFVCWMLLRHCTEALVYSNHPRAAAASSYLAIIFGRIASGVPWFLRSTAEPMQHPHQC